MNKSVKFKEFLLLLIVIQFIILLVFKFVFQIDILPLSISTTVIVLLCLWGYFRISNAQKKIDLNIQGLTDIMNKSLAEGFRFGEIGVVMYDDSYVVTWLSELFENRSIKAVGKKLLVWLPNLDQLISGDSDEVQIALAGRYYLVKRADNRQVLFFRDITEAYNNKIAYQEESIVVGMINLDNYEEVTQYEDEKFIATINNNIRQPVVEWCQQYGVLVRRIKNDRYTIILNERIYHKIKENRFSILEKVRKEAQELDVSITLSMAFARGSNDLDELDTLVNNLMDLAKSRGGDQVAIRQVGKEVKYFGGHAEAKEKRSKVRVRIMSHTLYDLIKKCSNVIILGHKEADFDCLGSAIAMSRIVQGYQKQCCIVAKSGGIEEKLTNVLMANIDELNQRHLLVTESEALNQLRDDTLVIMVDHHNVRQSNGERVLQVAKKVAIFDHHRRSADLQINPILVYIEAGASSTCELVSEFLVYLTKKIEINDLEANIMYAGILIDTNRFKVRCGVRTFDVLSMLRQLGAEPLQVDEYLKDDYQEFALKTKILNETVKYNDQIMLAPIKDGITTRSLMSQIANNILQIKQMEASFVIGQISETAVGISARSTGKINVQVIMEAMQGGGHLSAAACQRENVTVEELMQELQIKINEYLSEEKKNESNTIK